jgi:cysteine-rich repeat protein
VAAAASLAANPGNASLWVECGTVSTTPAFACDHQDPPTDPLAPSASETVTCEVANENCLIIVAVSDDFFANAFRDPYGCSGQDDNANAVIPVYCQGSAVCGDSVVEFPEECDPPSGATTNPDGFWCDAQCKIFHSCNNDGVIDPGEECDDGNTVNGDGCDDSCVWETQQAILNVCCNAPVIGQIDVGTTYDYVPLTPVQQGQTAQMRLTGIVDLSSIGIAIDLVVIAPSDVAVVGTAGTTSSDTLPIPTPQSINPVTQPLVLTGTNTMPVAVDPAATQVCLDLSAMTVNVDLGLTVACTTGTCAGTPNTPMCVQAWP